MNTIYDKKDIYITKLAPIIQQLKDACEESKIPFFVTIAYENTQSDTNYAHNILTPAALGLEIKRNTLINHSKLEKDYQLISIMKNEDYDEMNYSNI